jgi:tRNA1Val (adenine37-N6)-methyltransferase
MGFFYFKKFRIRQALSSMKVSTDSVLLPAWTNIPARADISEGTDIQPGSNVSNRGVRVLDAGCGTGVISLIMAQRMESFGMGQYMISAIDIDEASCEECSFNFSLSGWRDHLETVNISLQDYSLQKNNQGQFDLILSNPPFFTDSLKAPSLQRCNARHNHLLPLEDIVRSAHLLLKEGGVASLILPEREALRFLEITERHPALSAVRVCKVKTLISKKAKRWMVEIKKETPPANEGMSGGYICEELVIQREGGECYTREYVSLVGEYYTKEFRTS